MERTTHGSQCLSTVPHGEESTLEFTATQKQRLIELDIEETATRSEYTSEKDRDAAFRTLERELVESTRERLTRLQQEKLRPSLRVLEWNLVAWLTGKGFVEVSTPTTLARGMLTKMGIGEGHPLLEQVYWIDRKTCLRPMLAPNLYHLMGHVTRTWSFPVRMFEIGSCFRKESKGSRHLSEFTMLNLVEMGMEGDSQARLEVLAHGIMEVIGLPYRLETEKSEVYGDTTDILADGVEIASGAVGPHPLDANWNIADSWAGLGIGLERVVMLKEGFHNIRRVGRSLMYLDGARLNV